MFSGLRKDSYLLINTNKSFEQLGLGEYIEGWTPGRLCTVSATETAVKHVGRPVPNVPLLAGFAAMSGVIRLESVIKAIQQKFSGKVAQGNIAAATEAYAEVLAKMEQASQHAQTD